MAADEVQPPSALDLTEGALPRSTREKLTVPYALPCECNVLAVKLKCVPGPGLANRKSVLLRHKERIGFAQC